MQGIRKESVVSSWYNLYASLFREFLSFQRPHGTPVCSPGTGSRFWQKFLPLHLCLAVQIFIFFWATHRKASYYVLMKTNKQEICPVCVDKNHSLCPVLNRLMVVFTALVLWLCYWAAKKHWIHFGCSGISYQTFKKVKYAYCNQMSQHG